MKRKYIDYNCNTMIFGKLNISGIAFFVSYIFEMIEEKRREEKRREEKRREEKLSYTYIPI